LEANPGHPDHGNITVEVDLITLLEKRKHNHYEDLNDERKEWGPTDDMMVTLVRHDILAEAAVIASREKIPFNSEVHDDAFFALTVRARKEILLKRLADPQHGPRLRARLESAGFDEKLRCQNDRDLDTKIELSLEYIRGIITPANATPVQQMSPPCTNRE
jgi:hypothetical protein